MALVTLLHVLLHFISMLYQTNAFSMEIIPINSPNLKILPESFTVIERQHFLRDLSLSRALYNKRHEKLGLDSIHSPLFNFQSSYFVTRLTFGVVNPAPVVIFDTFSDQIWIQCDTCDPCFNLTNSISVEESESYIRMTPTDTRCSPKLVVKGSCGFEASLGNGHTRGYVGTDTFKFNEEAGYFPNIAFGCGIQNTNFSFGTDPNNQIAGVVGLGIGPRSMLTQLDVDIKGRFTYCLRSDTNSSNIIFGDDAQIVGGDTETTETIDMNPDARYHLNLAGITVQGRRLYLKPSLFQLDDQNFKSGFFIDPSAAYTVLTYTAYMELKSAILEHFSAYQMDPIQDSTNTHVFDLCYSTVPDEAKGQVYPSVTFNFVKSPGSSTGEVKLQFDQKNVFAKFENGFCLQMLSTPDSTDGPSFFGAFQQTNIQFLFDVNARMLSFVSKEC